MKRKVSNKHFLKYKPLIISKAFRFAKAYGLDYDDTLSQAHLIFCEAYQSFDKNKGTKFITYLYNCLNYDLKHYRDRVLTCREFELKCYRTPDRIDKQSQYFERIVSLADALDRMSKEAKEVVALVFESPAELLELNDRSDNTIWAQRVTKKLLFKYFTRKKGWTSKKTFDTFTEIRRTIA